MTKSIFASKTFWMNLISGLITLIGLINPELLSAIGISDPAKFLTIMGSVTALLNIILRFLTSQAVTLMGTPASIENKQ